MTYLKPKVLSPLLDRPIAFYRCFVTLTSSVNAALMLSQAVYWQLRAKSETGDWYKTQAGWAAEIGLSRREQETARRELRQHTWWNEEKKEIPAQLFYRVDLEGLVNALNALPHIRQLSSNNRDGPVGRKQMRPRDQKGHAITEITNKTKQRPKDNAAALQHISQLRTQLKGTTRDHQ